MVHYTNMRFLLLIILFSVHSIFSQNYPLLIPYKKGKLWGYCDSNRVVKIEPKFIAASFFDNYERALVKLSKDELGFIDNKGSVLTKYGEGSIAKMEDIYFHSDSNNRYQLLDIDGKPISNYVFNFDPDYHLGEKNIEVKKNYLLMRDSALRIDNKFGLIDRNGKVLIPFNMEQVKVINDSLLACVEYIPFTSFRKYNKKQLKKLKNYNVTDTILGKVVLYSSNGKKIKEVRNSNFYDRGGGYGFYCYKDFFIEIVKTDYTDKLLIVDYEGNIRHTQADWSWGTNCLIEDVGNNKYVITNREGDKAIYDGTKQRFISDFKFDLFWGFYQDSILASIKSRPYCYIVHCDSIVTIDSVKWNVINQISSKSNPVNYDKNKLIYLNKVEKNISIKNFNTYFEPNTYLKKLQTFTPLFARVFRKYYLVENYGWFTLEHKLVTTKCTNYYVTETPYDKLFYLLDEFIFYGGLCSRLISVDGIQYWDD